MFSVTFSSFICKQKLTLCGRGGGLVQSKMGLSGWTKLGRDYPELGGFNTTSIGHISFILPLRDMSYHNYRPHTRAVLFCISVLLL